MEYKCYSAKFMYAFYMHHIPKLNACSSSSMEVVKLTCTLQYNNNMDIKDDCYCYIKSNDSFIQRSSNMQTVYKVISSIHCKDVQ